MLLGTIIFLDRNKKEGQVEQIPTKRVYPFSFSVWDGEEEELAPNLEVEFTVESRVVAKMKLKISLEDAEAIPVSYTHLTLPTNVSMCRSRWSPYH